MKGIIEDNMPRAMFCGIRLMNGVKLHADVLFRSRVLFDNGDKVLHVGGGAQLHFIIDPATALGIAMFLLQEEKRD